MRAEAPAFMHQDDNIPRETESVRDDHFSPSTTDQPISPSRNLSIEGSSAVKMSYSEKEPELESCCLSEDNVVATVSDVLPPAMDSVASTSCSCLSSKPTVKDEYLPTASCQTQDSGFADASIKPTTYYLGSW